MTLIPFESKDTSDPGTLPTLSALELQQLKREFLAATPFKDFQFVNVTFGTANADLDIRHDLIPDDPENIRYWVVWSDRATSLYHDYSGTRKAWGKGYIILRSSVASAVVKLLIFIPRS